MIVLLIKKDIWEAETLLNHEAIPSHIRTVMKVGRYECDPYSDWVSFETSFVVKLGHKTQAWVDSLGEENYVVNKEE